MIQIAIDSNDAAAKKIAEKYAGMGLPCEIEAGPAGIIVYAASLTAASTIARSILESAKAIDHKAKLQGVPQFDPEEDDATCWTVTIELKWNRRKTA